MSRRAARKQSWIRVLSSGRLSRTRSWLAIAVTDALYIWLMFVPQVRQPGWSLSAFKSYGNADQLSYLAIAVNWAHGNTAGIEPFTGTGHNYYPDLYYVVMGLIARILHLAPTAAWNLLAFAVQLAFITGLGWLTIRLTARSWSAPAALIPIATGTLGSGWFVAGGGAALWGPFGMIAANNGEVAGLMLGFACLTFLLLRSLRPQVTGELTHDRVMPAACAFGVGLLADIHTYAFIDTTYVLIYGLGAWGIAVAYRRRWAVTAASVGLLVLSVPMAHVVARHYPLAAIVCGLLGSLPGVVLAVRRIGFRRILLPAGVFLLGALPQLIVTLSASLGHDPFMAYRQVSSGTQSLSLALALRASIVGLVSLLCVVLVGLLVRQRVVIALSAGITVAWLILTKNNFFWGSAQEPYRQWIDTNFLVLGLSTVALAYYARPAASALIRVLKEPRPAALGLAGLTAAAVVAFAATFGFSVPAVLAQRQGLESAPALQTQTPLLEASTRAAKHTGGLILPDPCIDPRLLKAESGARVAYYNEGMAWPDSYRTIAQLMSMSDGQTPLSLTTVSHSGIAAVLTWSGCSAGWDRLEAASGARLLDSEPVSTGGKIDLWAARLSK